MKITPNPANVPQLNTPPAPAQRGSGGAPGVAGAGNASPAQQPPALGASLVGLSARALAQPEVRAGLVAHFQNQIAAGAYHPDPAQTAGSLLADPLTDL